MIMVMLEKSDIYEILWKVLIQQIGINIVAPARMYKFLWLQKLYCKHIT